MAENKKYSIHVELVKYSDLCEPEVLETHDLTRWGVSEKQVIARLRHSYGWYDHDNETGSVAYNWEFTLTQEEPPKYKQMSIFDQETN